MSVYLKEGEDYVDCVSCDNGWVQSMSTGGSQTTMVCQRCNGRTVVLTMQGARKLREVLDR